MSFDGRSLGVHTNLHICFTFLETKIIGLHFAANDIDLSSKFRGALRKTILFLQHGRFSRSRSSKVIIVDTNRKRACDFLLVRNSNLGPILHRFWDQAGYMCFWPTPILP